MSKDELRILIERVRAANSASKDDEVLDETCSDALMILDGAPGGLDWSPERQAGDAVSRLLEGLGLDTSLPDALLPSDLLPLTAERDSLGPEDVSRFASVLSETIRHFDYAPRPAYFVRAPKSAFTTRPAAVMDAADRVVFESLAGMIRGPLEASLPGSVLWPRQGADRDEAYAAFQTEPSTWKGTHSASADIESFYEYVDHAILARIAKSFLGADTTLCLAIEKFLDAIMDSNRGLPQGPAASDTFASLYLLPLDEALATSEWEYVRYQDDFNLAGSSYEGAREVLRQLETALREIGLRLSPTKTTILTRETVLERASRVEVSPYSSSADESVGPVSHDDILNAIENLTSERSDSGQYRELRVLLDNAPASVFNEIPLNALGKALEWFPRLAESIAKLLASRRSLTPVEVDDFIFGRVAAAPYSDWENAWLCSAFDDGPQLSEDSVQILRGLSRDANMPNMTRYVCVRVLWKRSAITLEEMKGLLSSLPQAFHADLLLDLGPTVWGAHAEPRSAEVVGVPGWRMLL